MKRTIAFLLIAVLLMSVCAFAETAAPSVTVSQIIVPVGDVVIAEDFVIALQVVAEDRTIAEKVLQIEFPTLSDDGRKAALDRAYEDQLWSVDGFISQQAVDTCMEVVTVSGLFGANGITRRWSTCSSSRICTPQTPTPNKAKKWPCSHTGNMA